MGWEEATYEVLVWREAGAMRAAQFGQSIYLGEVDC